jgi:pyroglutamyl-peptidase
MSSSDGPLPFDPRDRTMRTVVRRRLSAMVQRLFGTVSSPRRPVSLAVAAALFVLPCSVFGQGTIPRPATSEQPRTETLEGGNLPPAKAAGSPARPAAEPSTAKEPVILLTGFQPFGRHRLPNASWQGIKDLDGRKWHGYRIVAREIPVVWGAPLKYLPGWIDEYKPVAIFSFGMGGPGAFALETWACNKRARYKDNEGKRPAERTIAAEPEVFRGSIDSKRMARLLKQKEQTVRISTSAGRYLCEENLYSLEYLKKTKHLSATVMFCHVPPLGTKIAGKLVTRDYVEHFVLDVLDSWLELYHPGKAPLPVAQGVPIRPAGAPAAPVPVVRTSLVQSQAAKDDDPRLAEIRAFVERYFRSWSDQDMDAYDSCFLPEAFVQFIDDRGAVSTTAKRQFVAQQREVHRRAEVRNVEVPESVDVRMEGKLAHAVVFWKLTSGAKIQKGYDHFTLLRREGRWRIVNLVFYATALEE